jgi:DNA polymerase I-like protein with 3'-5' exonuclease and polymerase domains
MIISLDTETTGKDQYHGATAYLVTICDEDWNNTWWEWDVDPLTRKVAVDPKDCEEIADVIEQAELIVLQHAKFDITALANLPMPKGFTWPFNKTRDTLFGAHLLASNHRKDLNSQAVEYLAVNISKYEDAMEVACKKARNLVRRKNSPFKDWRIAKEGLPEMPSAKSSSNKRDDKLWKNDAWLPKAIAQWSIENSNFDYLPEWDGPLASHPWLFLTSDYANVDSSTTLAIYQKQMDWIESRGLMNIYMDRMKLIPIVYEMERRGVTVNRAHLEEIRTEYIAKSEELAERCLNIARSFNYDLELPKGANNNSLKTFVFGKELLNLPRYNYTDTGQPSLDKGAMEHYRLTLNPRSKGFIFVDSLWQKRKRDTAISYMNSYERFWVPTGIVNDKGEQLWFLLHPSVNPTGTDTLRWSSSNPNEQNISKQGMFEGDKRSIRYCFGPAPGREWWSLDAKNIELRIPAYESGERELIDLFERPDEPPYYGSTHLLNFHTVYPDIWEKELKEVGLEKVGPHCKKKYASTWYQYCKNGGFAVQYGAVDLSDQGDVGTADLAFHRPGSHAKLKARFSKLEALNKKYIDIANQLGYVETIPDRDVDPDHGYPLLCTRSNYGKVKETVPFNYHTQSTAMQWMGRGMIRCQEQLNRWRESEGFDGYITMQVHDELDFDFPRGRGSRPWLTNLPRVKVLAELMAKGGEAIGVPTPVGIEYHSDNWAEGITL